ncbi:DUF6164 family protein [Luteimonas panaciterrae]|uniref:DUF6164 family protein n=1 Tax=Luteimonas panaciterrae TaxID=363885 RepID=UPI001CFBC92A|nr:DUF6164 family protein [Luteimonas panaciterrae]
MAKLLLNLRMVPEDEADDVRAFLDANDIGWYETKPSRWGISYGGIWVKHDEDIAKARQLMADYQTRRRDTARAAHAQAQRDGTAETFADVVRESPLRVVLTLLAIVFLLGLVALPVWLLHK